MLVWSPGAHVSVVTCEPLSNSAVAPMRLLAAWAVTDTTGLRTNTTAPSPGVLLVNVIAMALAATVKVALLAEVAVLSMLPLKSTDQNWTVWVTVPVTGGATVTVLPSDAAAPSIL